MTLREASHLFGNVLRMRGEMVGQGSHLPELPEMMTPRWARDPGRNKP